MNVPCRGKTTPVFRDRIGIVVRSESPVFIVLMFMMSRLSARPIGKKYPEYPLVFFRSLEWTRNAFVTCVETFDQKVELDDIVSGARARDAESYGDSKSHRKAMLNITSVYGAEFQREKRVGFLVARFRLRVRARRRPARGRRAGLDLLSRPESERR